MARTVNISTTNIKPDSITTADVKPGVIDTVRYASCRNVSIASIFGLIKFGTSNKFGSFGDILSVGQAMPEVSTVDIS